MVDFTQRLLHDKSAVGLPFGRAVCCGRVTKGAKIIGEFTGRSVGSAVYRAAIEQAEPGRAVWLKTDFGFRRVKHRERRSPGRCRLEPAIAWSGNRMSPSGFLFT